MNFRIFICLLIFPFFAGNTLLAQTGFTDKNEAENKMVDGKRDGKWIEYFDKDMNSTSLDDATSYFLTTYSKGIILSDNAYFMNGQLKQAIPYSNGRKNGIKKIYFQTGELGGTYTYKNDTMNGLFLRYRKSGAILDSGHYVHGLKSGYEYTFFENGKTESILHYEAGKLNGKILAFYASGQKQTEINYKNDVRDGFGRDYYENGVLSEEIEYSNGQILHLKTYYKTGAISLDECHQNNPEQMCFTFSYYKNGQIWTETPYVNGKKNGIYKKYDSTGVVTQKVYYKDDDIEEVMINNEPINILFSIVEMDCGTLYSSADYYEGYFYLTNSSNAVAALQFFPIDGVTLSTDVSPDNSYKILKPHQKMKVTYRFDISDRSGPFTRAVVFSVSQDLCKDQTLQFKFHGTVK